MIETASDLRGVLVVAREEGAQLGTVSDVYIDTENKLIAAISFRSRGLTGRVHFVLTGEIQLVGRDVILVVSERSAKPLDGAEPPPGKSLRELQGCWVTTLNGKHLGTLVDLDFSPGDWEVSELTLAEDKHLPVTAGEIKIADEILVPVSYADRVQKSQKDRTGVLGRVLGTETVADVKKTIQRVLKRSEPPEPEEQAARVSREDDDPDKDG